MNPGWSVQGMYFLNLLHFNYPGDVTLNPGVQLSVIQDLALMQHSRVTLAQVTEKIDKLLERKCEKIS